MPPTVAAVIVNFNGRGLIEPCLQSIFGQQLVPDEIVVVDNDSADGSAEEIERLFPSVRLLRPGRNLGYAGGCNLGIRATSSDLVATLNNDVVLDRAWLSTLFEQVHAPWTFWASRILFFNSRDIVDSAGDGMAVVGAGYKTGHGESAARHTLPGEVFGPCAAAALYERSLLEDVGGFDEDFFLVYEDADLSMRARLKGHRCLYVPDAVAFHRVNQSIGNLSSTYVYYGHRNSEILFWKNMPASLLALYLPERLAFDLLSLGFFAFKGRGVDFLRAKLDCLRQVRRILDKRKEVQSTRAISIATLRSQLDRNWLRYRRKLPPS